VAVVGVGVQAHDPLLEQVARLRSAARRLVARCLVERLAGADVVEVRDLVVRVDVAAHADQRSQRPRLQRRGLLRPSRLRADPQRANRQGRRRHHARGPAQEAAPANLEPPFNIPHGPTLPDRFADALGLFMCSGGGSASTPASASVTSETCPRREIQFAAKLSATCRKESKTGLRPDPPKAPFSKPGPLETISSGTVPRPSASCRDALPVRARGTRPCLQAGGGALTFPLPRACGRNP